jgi:hypothetical protein
MGAKESERGKKITKDKKGDRYKEEREGEENGKKISVYTRLMIKAMVEAAAIFVGYCI